MKSIALLFKLASFAPSFRRCTEIEIKVLRHERFCGVKAHKFTDVRPVQRMELALAHKGKVIIYHNFLPTPRRGSHVKSDKTHTQSSRYTPEPIYLTPET